MNWWVHDVYQSENGLVTLLSWVFWVLGSITLHELAHGWMAIRQGDRTPIYLNRMTANPVVHMGPQSLLIFAIIGIAWGQMPVNPRHFRHGRWSDVLVAMAGPMMNILLALFCLTGVSLWIMYGPDKEPLAANVAIFLGTGGVLNIVLAVFNLFPVPPLDGSRILAGFSRSFERFVDGPNAMMVGMFFLMAVFLTPLGSLIWVGADAITGAYIRGFGDLFGMELVHE